MANMHKYLPNNRPLAKVEAENIRDAACYFAAILEANISEPELTKVYDLLKATLKVAYDSIVLVEERGRGI